MNRIFWSGELVRARLENPLNKLKSWFWGKWVDGIQEERRENVNYGESKQRLGVFRFLVLLHRETSLPIAKTLLILEHGYEIASIPA